MTYKSTCSLFAVALFGLAPSIARANLIVNGDFENQPNYGPLIAAYSVLSGNQIPGWTIEDGHFVTVHGPAMPFISWGGEGLIDGGFTVNTDGEGINGNNANFYQNFNTANGASYQLDFDWKRWEFAAAPGTQLQVSLTDMDSSNVLFNGLYSALNDNVNVVNHVSHQFVGSGNAIRLRIQHTPQSGINDNNFLVDNFSVEQLNAVPEPASFALLGLASLGGIGLRLRQRRQAKTVA